MSQGMMMEIVSRHVFPIRALLKNVSIRRRMVAIYLFVHEVGLKHS